MKWPWTKKRTHYWYGDICPSCDEYTSTAIPLGTRRHGWEFNCSRCGIPVKFKDAPQSSGTNNNREEDNE